MRLVINRCKFCYADPQTCKWREKLKSAINSIPLKITVLHKCQEYFNTLPVDTRVEIALNEIVKVNPHEYNNYHNYEWQLIGKAKGTIIIGDSGDFFLVKLDEPVTLNLPERGNEWKSAKSVKVEIIRKKGKDCKIIEELI